MFVNGVYPEKSLKTTFLSWKTLEFGLCKSWIGFNVHIFLPYCGCFTGGSECLQMDEKEVICGYVMHAKMSDI